MQLIMDAEDTSIGIREKMSTLPLDQESLSDKPVLNGVQNPENDVPNGNKENIETKNNIIDNVSVDNEIKLVDEAVISSSVTEESHDDDKTEEKGSDEQVPDKGDANIVEKSIEDIVAEMDSFDDKENTIGEKAKETEKEEESVNDVCAALENVTEETSCIDDPRKTDCNKTDEKEELKTEKEPVPDNEERKDLEKEMKLTEKTGIDENEKNCITEQQANNTVVENAEIDVDYITTDKAEDNVVEKKVEDVIANEKDDNTATDQHLEKEIEEEKENVLLYDVNLTVDQSVNNSENESDNNKTVQNTLEKTDSATEEISLDSGESKIDEVEKTEPMETSQLSEISCNEVISSEIVSSLVSENEKQAQTTMECDEEPDETKDVAETTDSSDKTSEIVTNGIESSKIESNNDEEPMECDKISEISTSTNVNTSLKANHGDVVDGGKIDNVSEKQSDSVKIENEIESKTTGDCEITDLIEPICDKKDEESNSMECNDIIEIPEAEKKNEIITTSQETTAHTDPICNKKDVESNSMECNDIIEVPEAEKKNEIITTSQETIDQIEPICNKKELEAKSMECNDIIKLSEAEKKNEIITTPSESKTEILDVDKIKEITEDKKEEPVKPDSVVKNQDVQKEPEKKPAPSTPTIKLSNTLDILSDDEDEPPKASETPKPADDKCINIEDDDDIMLIDDVDDTNSKDGKEITDVAPEVTKENEPKTDQNTINIDDLKDNKSVDEPVTTPKTELETDAIEPVKPEVHDKVQEEPQEKIEKPKPLVPEDFFKSYRKDLSDMTRDDLEEFCILKIVESIIDRSSLNEIRSKLKTMAQSIDEYKKKALMLTKQNRDLQVVLKSVQEEQKKVSDTQITPLKITRSVGMQVYMTEKNTKRKVIPTVTNLNVRNSRTRPPPNTNTIPRPQKTVNNQQIPVPRLVPANNIAVTKASNLPPTVPTIGKVTSPLPNGIKNSTPPPKAAEKRPHNRIQSDTVDLTDDEPPAKMTSRNPTPPVRLVSPQNLLATRQQFPQSGSFNSPRKVYIPISGPQAQVRPGQTIMLKSVPTPGPRQRGPAPMVRMPQNSVRMQRVQNNRHPAPLPDAMKQYQPPNWKALPPAPDLKLSKVENGIVISWKIDGYQEDSYEEIASYQLYAYQETSSPPNTSLWKKIGDVKALPLPMACTLTQFMAGYKYFFAVRAVDIRSRLGPFSLPGSILLLNKM